MAYDIRAFISRNGLFTVESSLLLFLYLTFSNSSVPASVDIAAFVDWDAKEYKSSWGDIVSWGGMKLLLNEGHLSTTNDASKKALKDDVVNFYLKNCLSMHGLLKCGQETSQGNFFFFTTYLYQTLLLYLKRFKCRLVSIWCPSGVRLSVRV